MSEIRAAVAPTAQLLPLLDVSPERFQSFCRDFVAEFPHIVECHQYGVSGNAQLGIDLVATTSGADTLCYQCRRVQTFDPGDLRKLATDVSYEANHYWAVIACRATRGVRDEEKKHETWTVWDVDDVSSMVRRLPQEKARRLVRTNFGGQWCRDFLGIEPFTAFLEPDDFFAPLVDSRKIFNHSFALVGRDEELEQLRRFVQDPEKLILVLPGRGGIGKSKLLQVVAREIGKSHAVLFAQLDVDITPEALGDLPLSDLVIVIDDAHRRKDLRLLFAYAVRTRTKLILSTRPQLLDELPSLASRHHIDPRELQILQQLAPLEHDDVERLAREVLGPDLQHIAHELAAVTRDCSLVTVVGGYLLREKRIPPSLLADDEAFRETALARFFDEIVEGAKPGSEERALRTLLEVIAALAPVQVRSKRFAEPTVALTGMEYGAVAEWCQRLERHGVLAARHDGLRIVPDLLSDYILGVACARPAAAGQGFVDRIVAAVEGFDPALLRNLAAVDWRVGGKKGEELQVLGGVWATIIEAFKNAPNSERLQMLRQLRDVGFFLPRQMLQLAKLALDSPATAAESGPFAAMVRTTHEDVLSQLPEAVRFTAYSPSTFDSTCDFLWRLANDARVREPHAALGEKSALSILIEIMAPGLRKPAWVHFKLMDRIDAWRKVAHAPAERRGIVRILGSLLAKTGEDHWSDDLKITIRTFALSPTYLRGLRDRTLEMIADSLEDPARIVVGEAVEALTHAVQPPVELAGLRLSEDDRTAWKPERLAALSHLERLAARTEDPVIGMQIRQAVEWYADEDYGGRDADIKDAATRVLKAISTALPVRIAHFVKNPWGNLRSRLRDEDQAEVQRQLAETATETVGTMAADAATILISDIIAGLGQLGLHPVPGHFLSALARANAVFAARMCEVVIEDDALPIAPYVHSLMLPLRQTNPDRYHELVERLLRSNAHRAASSVAAGYTWWIQEADYAERDLQNIRALSAMGSSVSAAAVDGLRNLAKHHPRVAAELAMAFDVWDDQARAEKLAEAFFDSEHALFDALSSEQLTACVLKLEAVPQLDGTHLGDFVDECGKRVPLAVLELLLRRLEREHREDGVRFTAIPFEPPELSLTEIVARTEYKQVLSRVRAAYMSEGAYDAPRLFSIAAVDMNDVAVGVLLEASGEHTDASSAFVASCMRGAACSNKILSDPTFVATVLDDAAAVGSATAEMMEDTLLRCAVPQTTTDALRNEIEARAATIRDGLPIAARARNLYDRIVNEIHRVNLASREPVEVDDEDDDGDA